MTAVHRMPALRRLLVVGAAGAFLVSAVSAGSRAYVTYPGGDEGRSSKYYDEVLGSWSPEDARAGIPDRLYIEDAATVAEYRYTGKKRNRSEWTVRIDPLPVGLEGRHTDATYRVILVLPVPADRRGRPDFSPQEWGIRPWERSLVPMIYGGERIIFERSLATEAVLLPNVVGGRGEDGKLPSLEGTGQAYTIWEAVVTGPPHSHAEEGCWATFRFEAPRRVRPGRLGSADAFLITWIPRLGADVPPHALRIPVEERGSSDGEYEG